jgi:hypothetical protein
MRVLIQPGDRIDDSMAVAPDSNPLSRKLARYFEIPTVFLVAVIITGVEFHNSIRAEKQRFQSRQN